jgi:hypothetical protein
MSLLSAECLVVLFLPLFNDGASIPGAVTILQPVIVESGLDLAHQYNDLGYLLHASLAHNSSAGATTGVGFFNLHPCKLRLRSHSLHCWDRVLE